MRYRHVAAGDGRPDDADGETDTATATDTTREGAGDR